jgi:hypothetical protein
MQLTDSISVSINDLVLLTKQVSMTQQTQDSVARKRDEQLRPRFEVAALPAHYGVFPCNATGRLAENSSKIFLKALLGIRRRGQPLDHSGKTGFKYQPKHAQVPTDEEGKGASHHATKF